MWKCLRHHTRLPSTKSTEQPTSDSWSSPSATQNRKMVSALWQTVSFSRKRPVPLGKHKWPQMKWTNRTGTSQASRWSCTGGGRSGRTTSRRRLTSCLDPWDTVLTLRNNGSYKSKGHYHGLMLLWRCIFYKDSVKCLLGNLKSF